MSNHARRLLEVFLRRHFTKRAGLMNLNQDPAQNDLSQSKPVQSQVSQLHAGTAGLQLRISCLHSSYILWLLDWVQVCPQPLSVVVIDMNLQNHALGYCPACANGAGLGVGSSYLLRPRAAVPVPWLPASTAPATGREVWLASYCSQPKHAVTRLTTARPFDPSCPHGQGR
jgi:hypothetical protein